jgi:hypothetical protein
MWQSFAVQQIGVSTAHSDSKKFTVNWVQGDAGVGKSTLVELTKPVAKNQGHPWFCVVTNADAVRRLEEKGTTCLAILTDGLGMPGEQKVIEWCIKHQKSCWVMENIGLPAALKGKGIKEWKIEFTQNTSSFVSL